MLDPLKAGAATARVALDEGRVDVEALLAAVTDRTKLAFLPTVNNPTGTMTPRADLLRFLDAVPEHVLTVIDEAYVQYVDDPAFADAIEEAAKQGRRVLVLRTFSKIYGLAALRIGYGVGPAEVVTAMRKVQRAFDVTTPAQEAALAEPRRRRGGRSPPRGQPGGDGGPRDGPPRARLRDRSRPLSATSSTSTSARTRTRSTSRFSVVE